MATMRILCGGLVGLALSSAVALAAAAAPDCSGFKPKGDKAMQDVSLPPDAGACKTKTKSVDGVEYVLPDPSCTPGAINPTLTLKILKRSRFRTSCERDKATSAHLKAGTYDWYGIDHPANNKGAKQTCELDHLISIEIGGADTLDNIWPQCGPAGVALEERNFKQKDLVENFLAAEVRAGKMKLKDVQAGIADNWTQYLKDAAAYYKTHKKRNDGG